MDGSTNVASGDDMKAKAIFMDDMKKGIHDSKTATATKEEVMGFYLRQPIMTQRLHKDVWDFDD